MAEKEGSTQISSLELVVKEESEQAIKGLDALTKTLEKLKTISTGNLGLEKIANGITKIKNALDGIGDNASKLGNLIKNLGKLKSASKVSIPDAATGTVSGGDFELPEKPNINSKRKYYPDFKNYSVLGSLFGKLSPLFSSMSDKAKELGSNLIKLPFNFIKNGFSSVGNVIGGAISRVNQFISSLGRIFMYRAIRTVLSEIANGFQEGIRNAYQFSKITGGALANSLDRVSTSMLYLRNSIGAAVAPLINALAPAIEFVISKLVVMINFINQVIASLTGQSTWLKAKTYMTQFAESADTATKSSGKVAKAVTKSAKKVSDAVKKATISIDELNIIEKKVKDNSKDILPAVPTSGAGSLKTPKMPKYDYSQMFEEVPISSAASKVADKIKDFFEEVKSYVEKNDWKGLGESLADKFNNVIKNADFHGFGGKVGRVIDASVKTALGFARKANFFEVGNKIAQSFNGVMESIEFEDVGALISKSFTNIIDTIIGFLSGLDWKRVGKTLSNFFIGLFDETSEWIESLNLDSATTQLTNKLDDFISNVDWKKLAQSVARLLKNIVRLGIAFFVDAPGKIAGNLADKIFAKIIPSYESSPETKKACQDIGKNMGLGIYAGLFDILTPSGGGLFRAFASLLDAIKNWWGISSPSKVMMVVGSDIAKGLIDGISGGIKSAGKLISDISSSIMNWFTGGDGKGNVFQKFYNFGESITTSFKNGINATYKTSKNNLELWSKNVKEWFTGGSGNNNILNKFGSYASGITKNFKEKINNTYTNAKNTIIQWASGTQDWFTNGAGNIFEKFGGYGVGVINRFSDKIRDEHWRSEGPIKNWRGNAHGWFKPIENDFEETGKRSVEGFNRGVLHDMDKVKQVMQKLGAKSIDYFNEKLGIKSPSKVFMESGKYIVEGLDVGIYNNMWRTDKTIDSWAEKLKNSSLELAFASVDTSGLKKYDANDYVGNIEAELRSYSKVSSEGFKESMENFYKEWILPVINEMSYDLKRQADKQEKTVLQIDGRTISETVNNQRLANGYRFVK